MPGAPRLLYNEAVENVIVRENDGCPVPACAPGDFTVIIGAVLAGGTMEGLRAEMAALGGVEGAVSLLLTWFEWVEAEVRGFPDLVEELHRLRGQVMSLGAAWAGTW
jgi:hypothetical protein